MNWHLARQVIRHAWGATTPTAIPHWHLSNGELAQFCVPAIQQTSDPLPFCRTFGKLNPVDSCSCDSSKHDGFVVSHVSTSRFMGLLLSNFSKNHCD